jgi:tetratricopeptide (TPR) repeat protein
MRSKLFVIAIVFLVGSILLGTNPVRAENLMARADAYWPGRADVAKALAGAEIYRKILAEEPGNFEAAWKLSRNMCWVAEHSKGDRREWAAEEAVLAAQTALKIDPDKVHGHFFLGVSYGYYGHAKGVFQSLALVGPIMDAMDKVLEIDPGFQCGAAYVALGRAYFFAPRVMGGGVDKAIRYYKKALKYCPNVQGTHLFMAEAYIKLGEKEKARKLLNGILAGLAVPGWEPEYEEWRGEAEYWMKKVNEMD